MAGPHDYRMFAQFSERYLPQGFKAISRDDPWIMGLEQKLLDNGQFFYIGELLSMNLIFTSCNCVNIIGINPEAFDFSFFLGHIHNEDRERYSLARAKVIKSGYELFSRQQGASLLSSHFRTQKPLGNVIHLLFQAYSFYSELPHKTVYTIIVVTDLSNFSITNKDFHYYLGNDMSLFRYPDLELLKVGQLFTPREFEIIRMIVTGLGSEQIADKLSLSVNTINTHRRNILKKTKNSTTHGLAIELKERGLL